MGSSFTPDSKRGCLNGDSAPDSKRGCLNGDSASDSKRGYLKGDFALFHLSDMKDMQFEYHYHDFNKIIIFISGSVTYLIEGRAYKLKPWDILLVSSSEVHKPMIDPSVRYERIAVWVNPGFLANHSNECDLFTCFRLAKESNNLLRLEDSRLSQIQSLLLNMEEACKSVDFGSGVLKNSIFLQLLVILTRELISGRGKCEISDIASDESIRSILDHINANIRDDLSIDTLAARFYMSRYHLMHKFKQLTGYTIHSYILQKRLINADSLIRNGVPALQACEASGFNDYSNFVRLYKRFFGVSPRNRIISRQT